MGFGFRKSFKIAPGVRMSVGKRGIGLSAGVKGLRVSANTSGRNRVTASIPGTGLSYSSSLSSGRRQKSLAYQRRNELVKQQKEYEKLQELERNRIEVELFENKLERIKSIHKECNDDIDWARIKNTPPPFVKGEKGQREIDAIKALESYKPNFLVRFLKQDEKKREELRQRIEQARREDGEEYREWEQLVETATRITNGDIDAYLEVIEDLVPLNDITEFGSGFEFLVEEPHYMEIEFDIQSDTVVPQQVKSLTKTGKVSVKQMPRSKYFDIQQDYVCSCTIRIARDMFALLPLEYVYIQALDERLDTTTGYHEKVVILSVRIDRATLDKLNFDTIDCSDSMANFLHNMKFKKTAGFEVVEKLIVS